MVALILAAALAAHPAATRKAPELRREVCPGALYFIKHGDHAPWTKGNKVLCRIGDHDFYGAPPKHPTKRSRHAHH